LTASSQKSENIRAIGMILLGYFAYSIADLCSKKLQETYVIYQVLGVSAVIGLLVTGLWAMKIYGKGAFFPPNMKWHMIRAAFVLGTAYFMVRSLHTLPLADFYGIVFLTPFVAMILSILFLNEKVGWRRWAAAVVGFLGVAIIATPQFNVIGEGVICALIGVCFAGGNIIALRKIGRDVALPIYGFYPFLFIAVFNLSVLAATNDFIMPEMKDAAYIAIHGPITVLGITCIALGFARARETAVVAPFMYTQIIWGIVFGIVFFGAVPHDTTYIGLALIIGAGLYSLWREYYRRSHPL
jgi:drug/metabolite transporter (DMT)-like permease